MTDYTKKDAAKDTGSTPKEVSGAWHKAKDDAAKEGGWNVPEDRHVAKEQKENEKSFDWGGSGK